MKIYVCNLMTKPGESDGFRASNFLRLVCEYLGTAEPLDYLLVNNAEIPERLRDRYLSYGQRPVGLDEKDCRPMAAEIIQEPLLSAGSYLRHDPDALAGAIMKAVETPLALKRL